MARDKEVSKHYKKQGWKIFRIWEHGLKNKTEKIVEQIKNKI